MYSNDQFLEAYANANEILLPGEDFNDKKRIKTKIKLMNSHSLEIADYQQTLFDAARIGNSLVLPEHVLSNNSLSKNILKHGAASGPSAWFHLIYAYMLENTRMYEIMARVLHDFRHGETLGVASEETQKWLQTTESIFFRQQSAHDHLSMTVLTSDARDDGRAIRRNAYFRMFGMDLNHGTNDNKPYPFIKPALSNRDFMESLELLLRELWIALVNRTNISDSKSTDDGAIESVTLKLSNMLNDRRLNGTLTLEEFSAVSTLDWLRVAISFNSPLVKDLKAEASSEAERLQKIAERVSLPMHSKADDYFRLAAPMSFLLRSIETQNLKTVDTYIDDTVVRNLVTEIITYMSNATGKIYKQRAKPSNVVAVA